METPGRKRRSNGVTSEQKQEKAPTTVAVDSSDVPEDNIAIEVPGKTIKSNGHARKENIVNNPARSLDPKKDISGHYEFGGSVGVLAIMLGFTALMYYMWLGATYYDGKLPLPAKGENLGQFFRHMARDIYDGAFPSLKAWMIYWIFFIFEAVCYIYLPGVYTKGKPLPHEGGKQLTYYCSGVYSWYVTIAVTATLHFTGLFPLYTIIDEFGPLMSVAIISAYIVAIVAYVSALYRGAEHRMTGSIIYDFFMGAELNPRMFGLLDFKMFFEVRIPWYILFLISSAVAARQYEQFGWVSGEVGFLVMVHFLYANACSKGEELIPPTWYDSRWSNITSVLIYTAGICITRNGASCSYSGTLLEFH